MPIDGHGHRRIQPARARASRHDPGQLGQLAADGGQVGDAEEVTRRDAQQLAPLPPPEPAGIVRCEGLPERLGSRRRCPFAVDLDRDRAAGRAATRRRSTADDNERRRARERDEAVAQERLLGQLRREVGMRLDHPVHDACAAARASAERSIAASSVAGWPRAASSPPVMQAVSRILTPDAPAPHCRRAAQHGRRRPRRQRDRIIDGVRARRGRRLRSRRVPRARRSRATRPRTSCSARRSSPHYRRGRSRSSRRAPGAPPRSSASSRRERDLATRRRCARTVACRACTTSTCCPTTRCSTSSVTSRPSTVDGPLFVVAGVRVARRRSARTRGARTGRSSTQAAGGAELVVNINASPYYAGRVARARDDARARAPPTPSVPVVYVEPRRRPGRAGLRRRVDASFDEGGHLVARAPAVRGRPARRRRRRASGVPTPSARPRGAVRAPRRSPRVEVSEARIGEAPPPARVEPLLEPVHEVYEALVLGTRDYVRKNGVDRRVRRPSPAASTRRSWPRSRSTRSGRST